MTLPTLSSGTTGNYNGVVIADSPTDYAAGQLTALDAYESAFGVRQVDGYMFPHPHLAYHLSTGAPDPSTAPRGTLTAAGLAAFPELKGPMPFDTGSFGYGPRSAPDAAGASFTLDPQRRRRYVMAGVYQHPVDHRPQAGVPSWR